MTSHFQLGPAISFSSPAAMRTPFPTIADLTASVGTSRSVLQERFARFIGEPPLSYLARWRMLLAARQLETRSDRTVLEIALDVGYQSEAAFNRAFKREHGLPPAAYRKQRQDASV